jgi:hypothetical protein
LRRTGLLLAAALLAAALPASAAPKGDIVLVEEPGDALRHRPTGIALPGKLGDLKRATIVPADPAIIIYAGRGARESGAPIVGIALGRAPLAPGVTRMRDASRIEAPVAEPSEILSEGGFDWPGHPRAQTFRGSYAVDALRKDFWHAWDGGYAVIVSVVTDRTKPEQIEAISALVADLFGKAATAAAGAKDRP